jgi:hypothetical protein
VTNAIDLAAQTTVSGTFAFVGRIAAAASTTVPIRAAAIVTRVAGTFAFARTRDFARAFRASFAFDAFRMLAIRFGAFFVKFVSFVRFVRHRFGSTFAFGRFIDSGWNIFVFVTRPVFALGFVFAVFVFFAGRRFFTKTCFFGRIIFARRARITSAGARRTSAAFRATTTARWRAPSTSTTAAPAAITITGVTAFGARSIRAGIRRGGGRRSFAGL